MRFYVEAYRADGSQILGNLDGQTVLHCRYPSRTKHVQRLQSGRDRPTWPRVHKWVVVDGAGKAHTAILNKWRNEL